MNQLWQFAAAFFLLDVPLIVLFIVLGVFFPLRLARTRSLTLAMPGRALLVGFVNFLFFGALAFVFLQWGKNGTALLSLVAVLLCAMLSIGATFGLAAASETVAERLAPTMAGIWKSAAGAALLSIACAFPLLGWFGLLPYTLLLGLGGFILSFFLRGPAER